MRKVFVLSILSLLLISSLAIMATGEVHASSSPAAPTPGHPWLRYKKMSISFVQNDAYESGIYNFPYQYMTCAWNAEKNQRVTVEVTLNNPDLQGPVWDPVVLTGAKPEAELIQYPSWTNSTLVNASNSKPAETGYIKAYAWDFSTSGGQVQYYNWPMHAYFTFLTNTTYYKPGFFEIDVIIQETDTWNTHTWWVDLAKIYGVFTVGNLAVKQFKDAVVTNTTSVQAVVGNGKWDIQFWYTGTNNDFNVAGGTVTGPNVKEMKDFGTFTKADNPINLNYTFNSSAPTGIYQWLYISENGNGTRRLYAFTTTVHDNATVLAGNKEPSFGITFSGKPVINSVINITISATDDNSTTLQVWVMGFYSNNIYEQPDPSTPLMQLWMYPLSIPNGGNKSIPVQLKNDGEFNVVVVGKDSDGAFNITRSYEAVQGFQGGDGGVTINNSNPWITWPWQSTVNMAILIAGVILMFTRRPVLQIIGIGLFFASFANWGYVGQYLHQQLTSWLPHWEMKR